MQVLPSVESSAPKILRTEVWFRRILILFAMVAGLAILSQLVLLLWAQNGFTGPEAVVAAHTMMLVRDGTLYYDFNHYPYTVAPYTPLFYLLDSGLQQLGLPVYTAARLISFLALLGIVVLSWYIVLLYTNDRYSASMSALLSASSALLLYWGTVGQVDVLAVFWGMAAFYLYSRYAILSEHTLIWAGVCAVLAFFTKQTMVACPAAICVVLWFTNRKAAVQFGCGCLAAVAIIALSLNAVLGGRFLADTLRANLNPYSVKKLLLHLRFALLTAGPLVIVAAFGARKAIRKCGAAPFVYLGLAALVFLATAPKVGSDLNYQLEFTVALVLCASLSLYATDFFRLSFLRCNAGVTLLQLPLGVFLVVNYCTTSSMLLMRYMLERQTRVEVAALQSSLADGGRVLSADYNAVVRLRGRLDVEMLIYHLLVDAGVVDPKPLQRDLAATAFSTVLLLEDVRNYEAPLDAEISTLPPAQLDEIRKRYTLVKHVPGPAMDGVYVYKPRQ